ncbi:MAG TPA: translation elongation factor 4 [Candidatus Atopostipes pullistercoris]|uniref:Elongation factor 4 n=1 Tax=Candidatus Atopostipes pullistercoris TaxID=2838467 RepID=A0A9D2G246_9LACT|nr:translation elongation factor 4 [Candidatus Atopostipes pullistercoris]
MDKNKARERQKIVRNFSIIAHIDHGKSTLADRILEFTKTIADREMTEQVLDSMDLERERGITIKLNTVEVEYTAKDGITYILHLIDTPGHVDFTYEVSRSLAACEGAILIVDAAQGIEAQTLANVYLALDNDLEIVPVINKIDLPAADPERVALEIEEVIGLPAEDVVQASAKNGIGIEEVLEKIVQEIPAPQGDIDNPLQALIFDSEYDSYRGVVLSINVQEGMIQKGDIIELMHNGKTFEVTEVGVFSPHPVIREALTVGDVGYVTANIKNVKDTQVGDTITLANNPAKAPLPGYQQMKPMVYSGMFPSDSGDYEDLREALERLQLNDSSLRFEPEVSQALGFGFRCGFLGMLHMDVVQERLEREFDLDLITTAPSVIYEVDKTDGETIEVSNPSEMPEQTLIDKIREPFVKATISAPNDYVGPVMELCQSKRGEFITMEYLDDIRVNIIYYLPLSEIVFDFFDRLKSNTKGYASLNYEEAGYRESDLVKVDILIHGDQVDALSFIVHKNESQDRGRKIVEKLKEVIPRQQFEIPVQAAIGNHIIARSTVRAFRKDVTEKLYGGDVTRRMKLLEKQKEGKKRMKSVGNVDIPQDAFMAVLNLDEDNNKNN